jgi:spore coat polysaccharide biosynthesis protein SpsF
MKIIATIEARMGSSRLPGKSLMKIVDKPMLELLIQRVKRAKNIDGVVVATTTNPKDVVIEELSQKMWVKCFRGSEDDVLDRVLMAAKTHHADVILELWGDNPLIDPIVLDNMIKYYKENNFDLIGTTLPNFDKKYPIGISALIFATKILEEVSKNTINPIDRENVSNYIYEHPEKYKIAPLPCPNELNFPDLRFTVDEQADFELIKTIFENLYPKNTNFSAAEAIQFLNSNHQLKNLNKNVAQRKLPGWENLKQK